MSRLQRIVGIGAATALVLAMPHLAFASKNPDRATVVPMSSLYELTVTGEGIEPHFGECINGKRQVNFTKTPGSYQVVAKGKLRYNPPCRFGRCGTISGFILSPGQQGLQCVWDDDRYNGPGSNIIQMTGKHPVQPFTCSGTLTQAPSAVTVSVVAQKIGAYGRELNPVKTLKYDKPVDAEPRYSLVVNGESRTNPGLPEDLGGDYTFEPGENTVTIVDKLGKEVFSQKIDGCEPPKRDKDVTIPDEPDEPEEPEEPEPEEPEDPEDSTPVTPVVPTPGNPDTQDKPKPNDPDKPNPPVPSVPSDPEKPNQPETPEPEQPSDPVPPTFSWPFDPINFEEPPTPPVAPNTTTPQPPSTATPQPGTPPVAGVSEFAPGQPAAPSTPPVAGVTAIPPVAGVSEPAKTKPVEQLARTGNPIGYQLVLALSFLLAGVLLMRKARR